MLGMSVSDVGHAVGGALSGVPNDRLIVRDVVSDSRLVTAGSLFVALEGTQVDGHAFADQALSSGAVAVLSNRPADGPTIVVQDVLAALGKLARHHVDSLPEITVIAITGSVGKTTTKDLLAQVLEPLAPTVAPPGSFNNELGLPMTVLSADAETRYLILEMGARQEGHVAYLCDIAPPHIGVVLSVGSAHMGEFGSIESIARAKAELVRALKPSGTAVLNADDARVLAMAQQTEAAVLRFGESESADVRALDVTSDERDRPSFLLATPGGTAHVSLQLSGAHLVPNVLAAAAVATALDVDVSTTAAQLSTATMRSRWRMETTQRSDGVIVVNDAYNASPESMKAALRSLKQIGRGRRTWAVLGEMRELGDQSATEHDALGRLAVRLDVQKLVVVGPGARPIHLGAHLEGSWAEESRYVPTVEEAVELVTQEVRAGDVVLVKASRAAGLERVAAALMSEDRDKVTNTSLSTQGDDSCD
jgi:UDP-N-acetylmuramoyl-tripeptide--D-alanyl-D-alanine ligase